MNKNEIFHVHTYRCGHAQLVDDEQYVKRAIKLGASGITFTDHAPFPDNPFGNRMNIEDLCEYVMTLRNLKEKYKDFIEVKIGLETEYLPGFKCYYAELSERKWFDVLMIGQHFYECTDGRYSFSLEPEYLRENEAEGICLAIIEGMKSGYFQVVAHPDRMFRKCKEWNTKMEDLAKAVIKTATEYQIVLERNLSSTRRKYQYWPEFWQLVPESVQTIVGVDAHSVDELYKMGDLLFAAGSGNNENSQ